MIRIFKLKKYPVKSSAIIICIVFILGLLIGYLFYESDYSKQIEDIGLMFFLILTGISFGWSFLHTILTIRKPNFKKRYLWILVGLFPIIFYLFSIIYTYFRFG